jgi:EpsI family protein
VTATHDRVLSIGPASRRLRETQIVRGSERRLVWQWFMVGGSPAHDRLQAKLLEVRALMRGRRDGAAVALSAPCGATCEQAAAGMTELLRIAGPRIEALANGAAEKVQVP